MGFGPAGIDPLGGPGSGLTYLDTAASYLYWQTNDAAWDMYHNYTQAPGYRSSYREMYKLLQTVKTISAAIRDEEVGAVGPAFPFALTQDLVEAQAMLQGLRIDVAQWTPTTMRPALAQSAPIGQKLDRLAATLSELMEAAGVPTVLTDASVPTPVQQAPPMAPTAEPRRHPRHRSARSAWISSRTRPESESRDSGSGCALVGARRFGRISSSPRDRVRIAPHFTLGEPS